MRRPAILAILLGGCAAAPAVLDEGASTPAGDDTAAPDPATVDDDGDGWSEAEGDCDDADPSVHPEGDEGEEPDGIDQDCDGIADDREVCPDSLQDEIDATPDGWTLIVCPGTWNEDLAIEGRTLALVAAEGPEATTIAGTGNGPVITIADCPSLGLSGFTITGGAGLVFGGGIQASDSVVAIEGNAIEGNLVEGTTFGGIGGGIGTYDVDGVIAGNAITGNTAGHGGGVGVQFGDLEISGNTISDNAATSLSEDAWAGNPGGGGGVFILGDADLLGNLIEGNRSAQHGGGFYLVQAEGEVADNAVSANTCDNDGAGGYVGLYTGELHDNTFEGNTAGDDAGGLRVWVGAARIEGNTFENNVSGDDGGGIKLSHMGNTLSGNRFAGNTAADAGGGVELDNDATVVTDCTFEGNAAARGGGLHTWDAEDAVILEDLAFSGNTATSCGGAVEIDADPLGVAATRIEMTGNSAAWGGGLCVYGGSVYSFHNAIFAANTASSAYSALPPPDAEGELVNAVAWGGEDPQAALRVASDAPLDVVNAIIADNAGDAARGRGIAVSWSDLWNNDGEIRGGTEGEGVIRADPLLVDPEGGDFGLDAGSPCVDAGDPDILDTDGTRSDMGAHGGPDAD